MIGTLLVLLADPPLDTPPDEAKSKVRRELLRPEYNEQSPLLQFLDWVERRISGGLDAASKAPPLSTFAVMVVFVALVLLLGWLLSRARRTAKVTGEDRAVLTDESVTADDYRRRAEAALAGGRPEDAVVDAYRALTMRQVERGWLDDAPGATAHEVALTLSGQVPALSDRVRSAAELFDAVLYGDRPATAEQATAVLTLDDELLVRR